MHGLKPTAPVPEPVPAERPFPLLLRMAFRGGVILLASALIWGVILQWHGNPLFDLCFVWLSCAWLVFPLGAFLGCCLPRWMARRDGWAAAGIGTLVGLAAGLALAAGVWVWMGHSELIGLVVNRGGGGYESYSYSVGRQLRGQAWHALTRVAPVTAVWVAVWAVRISRSRRLFPSPPSQEGASPEIRLRLNLRLLRLVGAMAASLGVFATVIMVLATVTGLGGSRSLTGFLIVGPIAAGLVVLGPWIGPLINPGGGTNVAWQLTAVGLPVLALGLAPFLLRRRPVRPTTAVVVWCGFVSALLFWMATGVLSLGWSLG